MIRTQIELPDELFARAKRVCEAREISLTELARRGIESILTVYSVPTEEQNEWQPPQPRRLGWKGLSDEELKAAAQLTARWGQNVSKIHRSGLHFRQASFN